MVREGIEEKVFRGRVKRLFVKEIGRRLIIRVKEKRFEIIYYRYRRFLRRDDFKG